MACLGTLKGIGRTCKASLAGVKEVYIADFDHVTAAYNEDTMAITTVTLDSGFKFYTYKITKQSSGLTSTLTKDEAAGTHYYTNEIALQFTKMEADKHLEISALAKGQVAVIVLDNNGKYWYVGADSYASATETTAQTGTSFDDINGYNITLQSMSGYLPFEVSSTIFEGIDVEDAPEEA